MLVGDQKCLAAAKGVAQHGIDGNMIEHMTRSALIELGVSEERAHVVHQALHKLSVKTMTWAGHEEEELARAPQESAQPLAGEELVAGVDYNDESNDVEVGSDRDLSDGGRGIHGSEVEDIAFMREVRAVRINQIVKAGKGWADQACTHMPACGGVRA